MDDVLVLRVTARYDLVPSVRYDHLALAFRKAALDERIERTAFVKGFWIHFNQPFEASANWLTVSLPLVPFASLTPTGLHSDCPQGLIPNSRFLHLLCLIG
jgi:hypothetical protein